MKKFASVAIAIPLAVAGVAAIPTVASAVQTPLVTISGMATMLDQPWGITADREGKIYVAERNQGVLVFAANASGNVAPLTVLTNADASLLEVFDVELDASGRIYVSHSNGISVFAAGSTGQATPIREITGFNAYGLAIGRDLTVYATLEEDDGDNQSGDIYVFAPNASGDAVPTKVFGGSGDSVDVAVDELGNVYLSNYAADSIEVWGPNAQTGDEPSRVITGGLSTIFNPYGIDVDCSTGEIVLSNGDNEDILQFSAAASGGAAPLATIDENYYSQGLGFGQAGKLYVSGSTEGPFINVYDYAVECQGLGAPELADTGASGSVVGFGGIAALVVAATGFVMYRRRSVAA